MWDAYRPIRAQKKFWEIMPNDDFVARPPDMTKMTTFRHTHMNGPCPFDTMDGRAALSCAENPPEGRKNGEYLKQVMESVGFEGYENEWWHFYDVSTEPVPYTDYDI